MRKTCLITGASAGIGEAFARSYAKRDHNLVLVARREDRLNLLGSKLAKQYGIDFLSLPADLHDPKAPEEIFQKVKQRGWHIDVLINNAGYGLPGMWSNTSWQEQADYLQLMVTSYLHLTHLCWPGMLDRGYGRVMHVA